MATLQLQNTNSNGAGAATTIAINTSELVGAALEPGASARKLARGLFWVGFLTLVMDLAATFYRPPAGVFGRHRLAYYLTLGGILAAGAAEVSAACWLSRSSVQAQDRRRRATLARIALCCSLLPLVVVLALGGLSVLVKS